MYPEEQEVNHLKLEIGLLKKDNEMSLSITHKLSDTLEKIQEMNSNLLRMISLHEHKHENHFKAEIELKEEVKSLNKRLNILHEKNEELEYRIADKIDFLCKQIKEHEASTKSNGLFDTLKEIEKYKWMVLGGFFAVGWLLGNINLTTLGTLLK